MARRFKEGDKVAYGAYVGVLDKKGAKRMNKRVKLVGEKRVRQQNALAGGAKWSGNPKNETIQTIKRVGEYKAAKKKKK